MAQVGPYKLDGLRNRLIDGEREIALSPLAARLLEILAREPGAIVDRQAIIDEIWRGDFLIGDPALHRVISEVRRATGDDPKAPLLIQTVHRRGYRLVVHEVGDREVDRMPPPGSRRIGWMMIGAAALMILAFVLAKLIIDDLMALGWRG